MWWGGTMGRFWALCMCSIISGTLNSESGYNWQCQVAGWWIAWLVSWLGSLHRWHINSGQLPPTNTQPALYLHSSLHPALVLRHPLSSPAQAFAFSFFTIYFSLLTIYWDVCPEWINMPPYYLLTPGNDLALSVCLPLSLSASYHTSPPLSSLSLSR